MRKHGFERENTPQHVSWQTSEPGVVGSNPSRRAITCSEGVLPENAPRVDSLSAHLHDVPTVILTTTAPKTHLGLAWYSKGFYSTTASQKTRSQDLTNE